MPKDSAKMEKIVALCKRRGFIFQSSEIYGGIGGFWDYGPLGVELKRNIKDAWWEDMVRNPPLGPDGNEVQMVGVDCSIIMNPRVWEASGHASGFADPMIGCKAEGCKGLFRADQVWVVPFFEFNRSQQGSDEEDKAISDVLELDKELVAAHESGDDPSKLNSTAMQLRRLIDTRLSQFLLPKYVKSVIETNLIGARFSAELSSKEKKILGTSLLMGTPHLVTELPKAWPNPPCPKCGATGTLTEPRAFNLMFKTFTGALEDSSAQVYLRPETAQGIFANFKNVCDSTRVKVPFGIAQIGKAFRNEINPRNFIFRSREFEQMEIEFFCHDSDAMKWWEWWRDARIHWYKSLGLAGENLVPRNQDDKELAHYSKACTDIEYYFPFADEPQELEGVAHRGCFDLNAHQTASGKDLTYFDDERKERFLPTVIEPSAGADRSTLAFICEAYTVDESRPSPEFMRFHPRLAPIKAAVFPLVNKDGMPEIAEPIFRDLKKRWPVITEAKQSIGKRYARMDEAGTPFCFTIDGQTKEDGTVTVRDRDTGGQERIDKSRVVQFVSDHLGAAGKS